MQVLPNTIKLYTAALLALFNKLKVQHNGEEQLLPVVYSNREEIVKVNGFKFEDLIKDNAIVPRGTLTFETMSYDRQRAKNIHHEKFRSESIDHKHTALMNGVPYNLEFTLSVYTSNLSDATIITEQICSKFNPFLKSGVISIDMGIGELYPEIELGSVSFTHPTDEPDTQVDFSFTVYGEMFSPFVQTQEIEKIKFVIKVEDSVVEIAI